MFHLSLVLGGDSVNGLSGSFAVARIREKGERGVFWFPRGFLGTSELLWVVHIFIEA